MGNAYQNASLIVTPNAYKASKIYALKPDDGSGDLSFSRAGSKMRRNSAGLWETIGTNIPPLHYPAGGGCPSWLFEPQRTNLITNSNNFSQSNFVKFGSTITPNALISPSGNVDADKLNDTATTEEHGFSFQTGLMSAAGTYTYHAFIKQGEKIWASIYLYDGSYSFLAYFNLATGTAGSVTAGATSSIELDANGYYKCSITKAITGSASANGGIIIANGDGVISYAGAGGEGIYIWNNQLEVDSSATSPIITSGSAVTRVADVTPIIDMGNYGVDMAVGYTYLFKLKDCLKATNQGQVFGTNGNSVSSLSDRVNGTTLATILTGADTRTIVVRKQAGFTQMWLNGATNAPVANTETDDRLFTQYTSSVGKSLDLLMLFNIPLSDSECLDLSNL